MRAVVKGIVRVDYCVLHRDACGQRGFRLLG